MAGPILDSPKMNVGCALARTTQHEARVVLIARVNLTGRVILTIVEIARSTARPTSMTARAAMESLTAERSWIAVKCAGEMTPHVRVVMVSGQKHEHTQFTGVFWTSACVCALLVV